MWIQIIQLIDQNTRQRLDTLASDIKRLINTNKLQWQ